jgi:hypothetical protein
METGTRAKSSAPNPYSLVQLFFIGPPELAASLNTCRYGQVVGATTR